MWLSGTGNRSTNTPSTWQLHLPGAWAAQRLSVAGTIFGTRAVAKIGPAPRRKNRFFGYHFKAQNMVPVFGPPFIIISTGSPKTGTKNGAGNFAPDCRNPGTLSQKSVAPAPENRDHRRPEGPARGPRSACPNNVLKVPYRVTWLGLSMPVSHALSYAALVLDNIHASFKTQHRTLPIAVSSPQCGNQEYCGPPGVVLKTWPQKVDQNIQSHFPLHHSVTQNLAFFWSRFWDRKMTTFKKR